MNERIEWIDYKNKRILFLDFLNTRPEEAIEIWFDAEKIVLEYEGPEPLLMICNLEGAIVNHESKDAYRKVRKSTKDIQQNIAIYGANEFAKNLIKMLTIFITNLYFVDDLDAAKEILVK